MGRCAVTSTTDRRRQAFRLEEVNVRRIPNCRRHNLGFAAAWLVLASLVTLGGCQRSSEKHYALRGRVISKDASARQLTVDNEDIPGFMPAMTMPYPVKDPKGLDAVQPG